MKNVFTIIEETKQAAKKQTAKEIFTELDTIWILKMSNKYEQIKRKYI